MLGLSDGFVFSPKLVGPISSADTGSGSKQQHQQALENAFQSWLDGGTFMGLDTSHESLHDVDRRDDESIYEVNSSGSDNFSDLSLQDSSPDVEQSILNHSLNEETDLEDSFLSTDPSVADEDDLNGSVVSGKNKSTGQAGGEWGLADYQAKTGYNRWLEDGSGPGLRPDLKNSLEEMVRANYQHRFNQTMAPLENKTINGDSVAFTLIYCSVFFVTLLYIIFKVTLRWRRQRDIERSGTAGYDGTNIPLNHAATSLCSHAVCQRSHSSSTPSGQLAARARRDAILPYSGLGAIWIPEIVSLHNASSASCSGPSTLSPGAVHNTGQCNNGCDNCQRLTVPPPSYTKLFLEDCPPDYSDEIVLKSEEANQTQATACSTAAPLLPQSSDCCGSGVDEKQQHLATAEKIVDSEASSPSNCQLYVHESTTENKTDVGVDVETVSPEEQCAASDTPPLINFDSDVCSSSSN